MRGFGLEGLMSHPGMAPVTAAVTERGNGEDQAPLQFTMAGDWILLVTGELPGGGRDQEADRNQRRPTSLLAHEHPAPALRRLISPLALLQARVQLLLLLISLAVVLHGLFGPQLAPRNLATVLTSIHWRGFLIVAIVAVGNLFCTGCPMVLARDVSRRFFHPRFAGRVVRGKWLGVALLVLVLFSYELFDLWSQPRATAWLVLGYFGLAIVIDTVFKGASFCKHLCPIGQFNFVASTMSPTELRSSNAETCRTAGRRIASKAVRLSRAHARTTRL